MAKDYKSEYRKNDITKNLNSKKIDKLNIEKFPRIITVFIVILIFGIAIGVILLIMIFPNQTAFYAQNCTDKPCFSRLGLECIENQCKCNQNSFYSKECIEKKSHLVNCHGISNLCDDNRNLICIDGFCKCNRSSFWKDEQCYPKQSYEEQCINSDTECITEYCNVQQMKCKCRSDRYISLQSMISKLGNNFITFIF